MTPMSTTAPRTVPMLIVALAISTVLVPGGAFGETWEKVDEGDRIGIKLLAAFDPDYLPPPEGVDNSPGLNEAFYRELIERFSELVWIYTEGTHYIKQVKFVLGRPNADIYLIWKSSNPRSIANGYRINLEFNGSNTLFGDGKLAQILAHEFGHFFYGLPDEYMELGKDIGVCPRDFDGTGVPTYCDSPREVWCPDMPDGLCPNEEPETEDDCDGDGCSFWGQCTGIPSGKPCDENADCADRDGICVGDWDPGVVSTSICNSAPFGTDDSTCIMGEDRHGRLCDAATHIHEGGGFFGFAELSLTNQRNIRALQINGIIPAESFNCWDLARLNHPELPDKPLGGYTPLAALGEPPPTTVKWQVQEDALDAVGHAILLVDASGSMGYEQQGSFAVEYALRGAQFFYKRGNFAGEEQYSGVYYYNTGILTVESNAGFLHFAPTMDINRLEADEVIEEVLEGKRTNIALAIDSARAIMELADEPEHDRHIIVFSDGRHNVDGADPVAAAEAACDAGINVHTIAFGRAANRNLAKLVQLGCGGLKLVAGTGSATGAPQNAHEFQVALGRMRYLIDGRVELLERRARLRSSAEESIVFHVPEGTERLEFAWMGSPEEFLFCCEPGDDAPSMRSVFNKFEFSLAVPGGRALRPIVGVAERSGLFRVVRVADPEPGEWIATIDKRDVPTESRGIHVGWTGFVDNPTLRVDAWVANDIAGKTQPVTIHASLLHRSLATEIDVRATVEHDGFSWDVELHDDGLDGDLEPRDGVYSGLFNPTGSTPNVTAGAYRVKVRFSAEAGVATAVPPDSAVPGEGFAGHPGTVKAEAETMFRLMEQGTFTPDGEPTSGELELGFETLEPCRRYEGLTLTARSTTHLPSGANVVLGDGIITENVRIECIDCDRLRNKPTYEVTFDAEVSSAARSGPRRALLLTGNHRLFSTDTFNVSRTQHVFRVDVLDPDARPGRRMRDDVVQWFVDAPVGEDFVELTVGVSLASNAPFIAVDQEGARGWSMSVETAKSFELTDATTLDTVAADVSADPPGLRDGGFERTEIVQRALNGGRSGVVSACVLSLKDPIALPPRGEALVLRMSGRIDASELRAVGDVTPPCVIRPVGGNDGRPLTGSAEPVPCRVTVGNESRVPCLSSVDVRLVAVEGGELQLPGDCNQDGSCDVSDAICLFGFLFLGTPENLPCGDGTSTASSNIRLNDFNGDGQLDLTDGVSKLTFLFFGGPAHALGEACVPIVDCSEVCSR